MSKEIKEKSKINDEAEDKIIEETVESEAKETDSIETDSEEKADEVKEENKEEKRTEKQKEKEEKRAKKLAMKEPKKKEKEDKKAESSEDQEADKDEEKTLEENSEDAPEEKVRKKKKKKKKTDKPDKNPEDVNIVGELLNLIIYIGVVVLICYFVITFVGCRSRVDGDSMNPTLSDADNLWVDKLSYIFGDPERFDVIIFNYNEDTTYVKRIIGLPGETVRIDVDGSIYIDGQLLIESYGNEVIFPENIGRATEDVYLGEDEYFVLGDNRNHSSDSRWPDVGNVHKDDILGKVALRIYPFTSFGTIK